MESLFIIDNYVDVKLMVFLLLFNYVIADYFSLHEKINMRKTYFVFLVSIIVIIIFSFLEYKIEGKTDILQNMNSYFVATSFYELLVKKITSKFLS